MKQIVQIPNANNKPEIHEPTFFEGVYNIQRKSSVPAVTKKSAIAINQQENDCFLGVVSDLHIGNYLTMALPQS